MLGEQHHILPYGRTASEGEGGTSRARVPSVVCDLEWQANAFQKICRDEDMSIAATKRTDASQDRQLHMKRLKELRTS